MSDRIPAYYTVKFLLPLPSGHRVPMGGGYMPDVDRIASLHAATVEIAVEFMDNQHIRYSEETPCQPLSR